MLEKIVKPSTTGLRYASTKVSPKHKTGIHTTAQTKYPAASALQLPSNVDPNESSRFSPHRSRDLNSSSMLTHHVNFTTPGKMDKIDVTFDTASLDPRSACYDANNAISLNSSMQSNVPQPFMGLHNYAISCAMPGGGWSNMDKYQAGQVQQSHYTTLRQEYRKDWHKYDDSKDE